MLAVQRPPRMDPPRLGSSQPEPDPDPMVMFGYQVDTSQDNLYNGAPEPAPGAPLLTETDNRLLNSFFEDMTSNQYDMPSFGEGLNFSDVWMEMPPQFMGSTTSLGSQEAVSGSTGYTHEQQDDVNRLMPTVSGMMPPPPPPPHSAAASILPVGPPSRPQPQSPAQIRAPGRIQPQPFSHHHSDDVLNAAATLLQNGPHAGSSKSNASNGNMGPAIGSGDQNHVRRAPPYPVGHLRHQLMEEFREENRRSGALVTENDQAFSSWISGPKQKAPAPRSVLGDIRWGSDSNFTNGQSYAPEPRRDPVEAIPQTRMKYLDCLEVNQSAVYPHASVSPTNGHDNASNGDDSVHIKEEEDVHAPPRKRRKSRNVRATGDEEDEDDEDSTSKLDRRRKPKSEKSASGSEAPSEPNGSGRRRKSAASIAKQPRENLSEEQKRENHIRSEQKRRTLIKEGFDDLGELVPSLKNGGFSKSATLSLAADWLEELLEGNKRLSSQLSALGKR